METLKQEIKKLAAGQGSLKLQRKTITFKGNRELTPQEAVETHKCNRTVLRHLYFAYGLLKGKSKEEMYSFYGTEIYDRMLESFIKKYETPCAA